MMQWFENVGHLGSVMSHHSVSRDDGTVSDEYELSFFDWLFTGSKSQEVGAETRLPDYILHKLIKIIQYQMSQNKTISDTTSAA